ncbi:hypothetical protein [Vacuolonema iberomarrocanum]|uniref:hypothetical protein n=1 Tax=Vacuolonema iberomarrocanum TaxID=3454632 RepID=UPI001A03F5C7|nr:hypothetical protein [filamentous cyanobacterium LEGE 07170]
MYFDQYSEVAVKNAIQTVRNDMIRASLLVICENYVGEKSISLLKRELGLE